MDHRHCGIPKKEGRFPAIHLGVSNNRGTPKWMVKIMENPIKMDDLGENPLFLETPIFRCYGRLFGKAPPKNHGLKICFRC